MERKWLVLSAVGVGTFVAALSASIINIVLPVVSREFRADISEIEWVVTINLLIVSGLLLSFGRLGDLRGHKAVYLVGFIVFASASPVCGLAQNVGMLIAARAVQAVGAAMLLANSAAILTKNFPPAQRGQALGLQGMMTYLGLTTGPSLGGWITTQFSWRAAFFLAIPVALVALVLTARFVPRDAPNEEAEPFDVPGALCFMLGLVLLLLALNQGSTLGWTSPIILALFGGAGIAVAIFVWIELRVLSPMLDLNLFRVRLFSAAVVSAILNYTCFNAVLFLMPFYLIQGRGVTPAEAGLLLTAQPLVMAITAPLSGILSDRIGSRLLATAGMAVLASGLFWMARLGGAATSSEVAIGLGIVGLGAGLFTSPNSSALMGAAPQRRQGIAAGILATARNVGMALGVGIAGAIFATVHARGDTPSVLFDAISAGWFVAAFIALLGAVTSAVRGGRATPDALV